MNTYDFILGIYVGFAIILIGFEVVAFCIEIPDYFKRLKEKKKQKEDQGRK